MSGVKPLRKIQLGREATPGTAVAATTIWRGMGTLEDQTEVVFPDEDVGLLVPTDRAYVPFIGGAIDLESRPATFEELPHILEACLETISPVQDGTGSDYIYQYDFPLSSVPTIKNYTIEGGDDQQAEEMEYSFVNSFGISGKSKEAVMMESSWMGRQITNTTFTGALSLPTVEEIIFQKAKLYVDDVGSGFGTTLKSNTLMEFDLSVDPGLEPAWPADGELYFSYLKRARKVEGTLNIVFEHDTTAVSEKTNWRNTLARAIQILVEGSTVATPGTTYSNKTLILNLSGKWANFEKLGEQNGNDVLSAEFSVRYNSTLATAGQIIIVNELSALP